MVTKSKGGEAITRARSAGTGEYAKKVAQKHGNNGRIDWEPYRAKAAAFAKRFKDANGEIKLSHTFWDAFFDMFGILRDTVAEYEGPIVFKDGKRGRIDVIWPGVLGIEQKSSTERNLDSATEQLKGYIAELCKGDKPLYEVVCNFASIRITDIEAGKTKKFPLSNLPDNIHLFAFMLGHKHGYTTEKLKAGTDAVDLMHNIYVAVSRAEDVVAAGAEYAVGADNTIAARVPYRCDVDLLMIRLLFCMFAEDTGIFPPDLFPRYLNKADIDGNDIGERLGSLFEMLNEPVHKRGAGRSSDLKGFPYVNGGLFQTTEDERKHPPVFNKDTRDAVIKACEFDWKDISPDIFGSLFQSVRAPKSRREAGMHYTSEENIMKVIRPLFLGELKREFENMSKNEESLCKFHNKIANLQFLDPACGCGNFLIVTYRELRQLEIRILQETEYLGIPIDFEKIPRVCISHFHGIEKDVFPHKIAEVAMFLVADQMNRLTRERCGHHINSIPLTVEANIVNGNALELDWAEDVIDPKKLSYIIGNPPFIGSQVRTKEQRSEMKLVFKVDGMKMNYGTRLDYVAAWYMKAARYIRDTEIKCAFVSTNSITQGKQVAPLWSLMKNAGVKINFAHRSFLWGNEASGVAAVTVVIIGFSHVHSNVKGKKIIYDYSQGGEVRETIVDNINGYLQGAADLFIKVRSSPLCDVPPIIFGSMPNDGGHLLLNKIEKDKLPGDKSHDVKPFVRPAIGAAAFLHNIPRWALWLDGADASAFRKIPGITSRMKAVKKHRKDSRASETRKLADISHLFASARQPKSRYLLVPRVSSGERMYIPMGFFPKNVIALDTCAIVPNADLYHFGVMTSAMHMAWVRVVAGRLELRYRYSNTVVYNTFPWPQDIDGDKRKAIKKCAQAVLSARAVERKKHPNISLGDMYSSMPLELRKVHKSLDKAVDSAYRPDLFADEPARFKFLVSEYNRLTADLLSAAKSKGSNQ